MERFLSLAGAVVVPLFVVLFGYRRWRAKWYTEDVKLLTLTSELDASDDKLRLDLRLYDERGFDQIVRNPFRRMYWGYKMFVMAYPWLSFIIDLLFDVENRKVQRAKGLHNAWRERRNQYLIPRGMSRDLISLARLMGSRDDKTARAVKSKLVTEIPFWAAAVVCQGVEGCCIRLVSAQPEEWMKLAKFPVDKVKLDSPRNIKVTQEKVELPDALVEAAQCLVKEFSEAGYVCNGSSIGHEVKVPVPNAHLQEATR